MVELRQLEAFVTVARELHFGRAANVLHLGQPTLSEMIRRLERELGTALFTRTTRRVALTAAGEELLPRASDILERVADAATAVRLIERGEGGTVHIGITPPVAPVLMPHLQALCETYLVGVELDVHRMWLPALTSAVAAGTVDVAITCGLLPESSGVVNHVLCAEPLLVALRPDHRLAGQDSVAVTDLADDVLGVPDPGLFPAWELAVRQALADHHVDPPTAILSAPDLGAAQWADQVEVDWVLLVSSLSKDHSPTLTRPASPPAYVPYTLQCCENRSTIPAVAKLVELARTSQPPVGWVAGTD